MSITPDEDASRREFVRRALAGGVGATVAAAGTGSGAAAQVAGPIRSFDHVAIPMRNTDAMLAFYRALGFSVMEGDNICSVHFGDNKINLHRPEFWQGGTFTLRALAAEPPCGDFCFVWDDTATALREMLDRAGAEILIGPVARTGGRDGGTASGTSHYLRDPDGNLLEFIVY
jgi:catechol 2,3-dioxygenase-like lactoylglutathione lyase family enzyme